MFSVALFHFCLVRNTVSSLCNEEMFVGAHCVPAVKITKTVYENGNYNIKKIYNIVIIFLGNIKLIHNYKTPDHIENHYLLNTFLKSTKQRNSRHHIYLKRRK